MSLFGCMGCNPMDGTMGTLPSSEKAPPISLNPFKARERRPILPGTSTALPMPEIALKESQCDQLKDGGAVNGPDCVTADITCGQTIIGHTLGGTNRWDTRFYEANFCTPAFQDYNGGDERVYRLRMPEGKWRAYVTLDSPCANLDMAGFKQHLNAKECPGPKGQTPYCEMYPDNWGKTRERIELVSDRKTDWLIVVEGRGKEEGAFGLTVQCRPGLQ